MKFKKNIAVFLTGIENISGGGGAERFWADISQMFKSDSLNIYFFIDKITYKTLINVNRINNHKNIIIIPKSPKNNLELFPYLAILFFKILRYKIKIIHIGFYGAQYYKLCKFFSLLPKKIKPKLSITIVSCFTPYCFISESFENDYKMKFRYQDLFNNVKIDGILTWYKKFKEVNDSENIIKSNPYIYPIKSCFTNLDNYRPSKNKSNIIVFASRLTKIKRPLLYIDVISLIKSIHPNIFEDWEFHIYGDGQQMNELKESVKSKFLENNVQLKKSYDLSLVFPYTKLFVSTQELENFTSLSMLEAMACENAIIAFDVGQTNYFVKDKKNGFLSKDGDIKQMANSIINFTLLKSSEQIELQKKSRCIAIDQHNLENFSSELDDYFNHIL
tara:strand:- start:59 stop:1225 length:1167 start_codon:yes stop_codon:yes gene_type:complete